MDVVHSCRCCLRRAPDKDLMTPYTHLDATEIYSEILKECFQIHLILNRDDKVGICDVCVGRLRDASDFKLQVQSSQAELQARLQGALQVKDEEPPVKSGVVEGDGTSEDFGSREEPPVKSKVVETDGTREKLMLHEEFIMKSEFEDEDGTSEDEISYESAVKSEVAGDAARDGDCASHYGYIPKTDVSDDSSPSSSDTRDLHKAKHVPSEMELTVAETSKNNQDIFEKSEDEQNEEIIEKPEEQKRIRKEQKRDYCFYCERFVLNFSSHVYRNHSAEPEVQHALSFPKYSYPRKNVLNALRKKGNYITCGQNNAFKPMKKSRLTRNEEYFPCTKCLGFYPREQLWKHNTICDIGNKTSNVEVYAQEFLLRNYTTNHKLEAEVFHHMRTDKISMEAKSDNLICAFGLQYLRRQRGEYCANVTSRKMCELAKLLIHIKKIKPTIKNLLDALKPEHYGTLVLAIENAAKFDSFEDRYESPTYAMNISIFSTSLKQCCDIALLESYMTHTSHTHTPEAIVHRAEVQAGLKTLVNIIQSNYDVNDYVMLDSNAPNESVKTPIDTVAQPIVSCSNIAREPVNEKKKRTRVELVPWTLEQKRVVLQFFSSHIKACKRPQRNECENLKCIYTELLKNKDWLKIKVFVQNMYNKK